MKEVAKKINCFAEFCGKRDIPVLNHVSLKNKYNIEQTDVMVLFGGSILQGGDLLAKAMKNNVAKNYIIVGGYGHTSSSLFKQAEEEMPSISKGINSKAELFF